MSGAGLGVVSIPIRPDVSNPIASKADVDLSGTELLSSEERVRNPSSGGKLRTSVSGQYRRPAIHPNVTKGDPDEKWSDAC